MARWEITEALFKNWIDWKTMVRNSKCKVRPSTAKRSGIDGHENCGSCPGNYYNGGECNFGGHHVLSEEVARINKNFDGLDNLTRRHNKLKTSLNKSKEEFEKEKEELLRAFDTAKQHCSDINTFIYGSCIGVEKQKPIFLEEVKRRFENAVKFINSYIESVRNLTQQQMQDFETKLKKVEELKEEISKLQQAYKNTTDPTEKARLDELISQKKGELRNLSQELTKHPAKNFWDQTSINLFTNLRQYLGTGTYPGAGNIKCPGSNPLFPSNPNDPNNPNQKQNQQKQGGESWFTPKFKETLKMAGGGILALIGLWLVYKYLVDKLNSE
ncbi:MAG: hypothetical protein MRERV_7c077 [Mycoplasmataceae bacterium RV_VA103A]|nr:MAG: hypothetical protein MRERV_7c077 [Mycoplasmataceae bacterium RV_VA103A]